MSNSPTHDEANGAPPIEIQNRIRASKCSHMVLTRARTGSPVLHCGSCPTVFIMSKNGTYIAFIADEADLLAQDLVGSKRMAEIAKGPAGGLFLPNG